MALNVGSLWASLSLDISNFQRGLTQATSTVRSAGSQIQQSLGAGVQGALNSTTSAMAQTSAAATRVSRTTAQATSTIQAATASTSRSIQTMGQNLNTNLNNAGDSFLRFGNTIRVTGKDIQRIIGGILISQAFYRTANAIEEATKALVKFQMNMETAQVSFTRLIGNADKAKAFVETMKDFAALTPYTTEQALEMSRRLMAMSFPVNQIKSVMTVITDAASALGGDSQKVERMVLAIGQIRNSSKLAASEIRQLVEAGVNAPGILRRELGLTAAQMQKVGKLGISGQVAATALLRGMEKQFKGMNEIIAETTQGMISTIKDDLLILGSKLTKEVFSKFSGGIRAMRNALEWLRKGVAKGGLRELLKDTLSPDNFRNMVLIIGSLRSIFNSFIRVVKVLGPLLKESFKSFASIVAATLPALATLLYYITRLIEQFVTASPIVQKFIGILGGLLIASIAAASLRGLFNVMKGITGFIVGTKAIGMFTKALSFLWLVLRRNPWVALISAIVGGVLYLTGATKHLGYWIDSIMGKLGQLTGIDFGKMLTPDENQADEAWQKYMAELNEHFDKMKEDLKGVGKEAGKAGKKVKDSFVASFDELYQIPDTLDDVGDGLGDIEDLSGLMDIPDFEPPKLPKPGPIGGQDDDNDFPPGPGRNNGETTRTIKVKFDPPDGGTAVATAIVESINNIIARLNALQPKKVIAEVFVTGQEALETVSKKLESLKNTVLSVSLGIVISGLEIFNTAYDKLMELKNLAVITITVDVIIPLMETLATLKVSVMEFFTVTLPNIFVSFTEWLSTNWKPILIGVLVAIAGVIAFVFGGAIVASVGAAITAIGTFLAELVAGSAVVSTTTGAISAAWVAAMAAIGVAIAIVLPKIIGLKDTIANWVKESGLAISTWAKDAGLAISGWATTAYTTISTWATDSLKAIGGWVTDSGKAIGNWALNSLKTFGSWVVSVGKTIGDGFSKIGAAIIKFFSEDIPNWITKHKQDILIALGLVLAAVLAALIAFFVGIPTGIAAAAGVAIAGIVAFFKTDMINGIQEAFNTIPSKLMAVKDSLVNTAEQVASAVKNVFSNTFTDIKTAIKDIGTGIGNTTRTLTANLGITGFANGGIIDEDQLIRAGEGGKREAMIPLENSNAMRPFAQAVANELGGSFNGNNSSAPSQPTVYVQTLIADDRGLRELERRLNVVRLGENQRKGVTS